MPKNLYIVTFLILALCAACDNPYSPDSDDGGTGTTTGTTKKDCNVTLRVANLEQVDYNEASNNEASITRLMATKPPPKTASIVLQAREHLWAKCVLVFHSPFTT